MTEILKEIITRDFVLGFCCCGLIAAGMAICWLFSAYCEVVEMEERDEINGDI
jgi:hypothetical protein